MVRQLRRLVPDLLARRAVLLLLACVPAFGIVSTISSAGAATLGYARGFGGTDAESALGVATDGAGNAYAVGYFQGTVDFDPGPGTTALTSVAGSSDAFVVKLNAAGTLVWARKVGGPSADHALGVAVDGSGNVYMAGFFSGTADFDPGPATLSLTSAGDQDAFVVKLNSSGTLVWARHVGGDGQDQPYTVAVDGAGNVYLTGDFIGTADFDPGPAVVSFTSLAEDYDAFVVKLNASGGLVWARQFGGTGAEAAYGLALDAVGNVYLAGYFEGTADFDPGAGTANLASVGMIDGFALKLNAAGTFVWARRFGGGDVDYASKIATDGAGNLYVVGYFAGTADFNPGPGTATFTAGGAADGFLVKFDGAGTFAWVRKLGGSSLDEALDVAADQAGNTYVVGYFQGTVDFDPSPRTANLTSDGIQDAFAVKFDALGNLVWARRFGGPSFEVAQAVATDRAGHVYLAGRFAETADFDPGAGTTKLTAVGSNDAFVAKLTQVAPPVHTVPGPQATAEDTPLVFSASTGRSIGVSDADAGSSPLRTSLTVANGALTLSTTAGLTFEAGDGTMDGSMTFRGTIAAINAALAGLRFTPSPNFNGTMSLQVTTVDLVGPTGGQTDTDSVTITVTAVDDPPVAAGDRYEVSAGAVLAIPAPGVLANDADPDAGTALTAQLVNGPSRGELTLNPNGSFSYTPHRDFVGTDTFTYRASGGRLTSAPTTVTIAVAATACAPRPRVQARPVPESPGRLRVTITATPLNGPATNALVELRFNSPTNGAPTNGRVLIDGRLQAPGTTYSVPGGKTELVLEVERVTAGQATTVPFTVVDTCGPWPTFVGGGPNAF